jgi:phosphonate transport system substrate-binding protein
MIAAHQHADLRFAKTIRRPPMLCARHPCGPPIDSVALRLLGAIAATLVLLCGLTAAVAARPFVIGSISTAPGAETKLYYPLAAFLGRNLGEFGFDGGKVSVARNIPGLISLFDAGLIDLYIDSPYPLLAVSQATGTKVILRRWEHGKPDYRSIIVVRKESDIRNKAGLKGRVIALESDFSTSGYLLPKLALQAVGLSLTAYHEGINHIGARASGYVFSRDEENTLVWILRGRVDAGAIGTHEFERYRPAERDQLRIIYESAPIPRQLVSVHKGASVDLIARIRRLLIDLEHTDAGRKILADRDGTTRFDDIPADVEKALGPIRAYVARAVPVNKR